jgi:hypothetical protein
MMHRLTTALLALVATFAFALPTVACATPGSQAKTPINAHAAGSTAAAPAASAPVGYQGEYYVEIIVFRALVALGSPEDWNAELNMAPTVSGGEAQTGTGVGHLVRIVPPSVYKLDPVWTKLRNSEDYHPVVQAAWIQTASDWGTHAGFNLSQLGIHIPGLHGMVYLERGVYLHLGLNIHYTMQHPPAGLGAPPRTTFVMNETRRAFFYQTNYFDNPAFGVIALVLPVTPQQTPG